MVAFVLHVMPKVKEQETEFSGIWNSTVLGKCDVEVLVTWFWIKIKDQGHLQILDAN